MYAYVSRGLIAAAPDPSDPRRSLYDALDVRSLLERKRRGRSRKAVAAGTVNWGEPVLSSAVTEVWASACITAASMPSPSRGPLR